MFKNIIYFAILLNSLLFVTVYSQSSSTGATGSTPKPISPAPTPKSDYPVPTPDAQICITALNKSGLLAKCRNDSVNKWNPKLYGKELYLRGFCCEIYGEIDCLINATVNGKLCTLAPKAAMINHQNTIRGYWQKRVCSGTKYHAGQCDPDQSPYVPPPPPDSVRKCFDRLYQKVNHCEDKSLMDWKVKPTDTMGAQSVCCAKYETNDCYIKVAQQANSSCNATEVAQLHQYFFDVNTNYSKKICSDYQYQSIGCLQDDQDLVQSPRALSCTGKIVDSVDPCLAKSAFEWNTNANTKPKTLSDCCANWDIDDCLRTAAQDKCTLQELSDFEQYFNTKSQQVTNVNCTAFPYHSHICKTSKPNPPKAASSCFGKIDSAACTKAVNGKKWKGGSGNITSFDDCCSKLYVKDCLESKAKDKCTVNELNTLQQYQAQQIAASCYDMPAKLNECKSGSTINTSSPIFILSIFAVIIVTLKI